MSKYYKMIRDNWRTALTNRYFVIEFILSILLLILTVMIFSKFTDFVELRNGIQFKDPFLETFKAFDLTEFIFVMIYGAILITVFTLLSSPYGLMILFESYVLIVLIRLVMMFFLPLVPPEGTIVLRDPVVELFGNGKVLLNDLFFSGHTATMFLLLLVAPKKLKFLFLMGTIIVALSVLLQKVHYTVDVLVAPFISYTCYTLVLRYFRFRYKNVNSDLAI